MKIFLMILGVVVLGGCSVHTPGASVSIGPDWGYRDGYYRSSYYRGDHYRGDYYHGDRYRDDGYFCPPGQAKKGRC